MKIIFPKLTYKEVCDKRNLVAKIANALPTKTERMQHILSKRLPFLLIPLFVASKTFPHWLDLFEHIYYTTFHIENAGFVGQTSLLLAAGTISGVILTIPPLIACKLVFMIVDRILPRKTPLCDKEKQYNTFLDETHHFLTVLTTVENIKATAEKLPPEEIADSDIMIDKKASKITLLLKDNSKHLITKQMYSLSNTSIMSALETSGELDFSILDKEWEELLQKYQIDTQ